MLGFQNAFGGIFFQLVFLPSALSAGTTDFEWVHSHTQSVPLKGEEKVGGLAGPEDILGSQFFTDQEKQSLQAYWYGIHDPQSDAAKKTAAMNAATRLFEDAPKELKTLWEKAVRSHHATKLLFAINAIAYARQLEEAFPELDPSEIAVIAQQWNSLSGNIKTQLPFEGEKLQKILDFIYEDFTEDIPLIVETYARNDSPDSWSALSILKVEPTPYERQRKIYSPRRDEVSLDTKIVGYFYSVDLKNNSICEYPLQGIDEGNGYSLFSMADPLEAKPLVEQRSKLLERVKSFDEVAAFSSADSNLKRMDLKLSREAHEAEPVRAVLEIYEQDAFRNCFALETPEWSGFEDQLSNFSIQTQLGDAKEADYQVGLFIFQSPFNVKDDRSQVAILSTHRKHRMGFRRACPFLEEISFPMIGARRAQNFLFAGTDRASLPSEKEARNLLGKNSLLSIRETIDGHAWTPRAYLLAARTKATGKLFMLKLSGTEAQMSVQWQTQE